MARFLYWTDLHNEFSEFSPPKVGDIDAVLLGGDTSNAKELPTYCEMLFDIYQVPAIVILGNHEGYGWEWYGMCDHVKTEFQKLKDRKKDIHLLNPGVIDIKDTRIIGATLWSDLNINGRDNPVSDLAVQGGLNDYTKISIHQAGVRRKLNIMDTKSWHQAEKAFIFQELQKPFDGKKLVLTHHQPTAQSVHPAYKGTAINPGFASSMDEEVSDSCADFWLYGHGHRVLSYIHERTDGGLCKMISNCRGYPSESLYTNFNPTLVIDTSS